MSDTWKAFICIGIALGIDPDPENIGLFFYYDAMFGFGCVTAGLYFAYRMIRY